MLTIGRCLGDIKTRRCGIIPYTMIPAKGANPPKLLFLLARHSLTKELGDHGGGIKKMEKALDGGFREFQEESRGIFSEIYKSPSDLSACMALIDRDDMAEIFVPVGPEWILTAPIKFHSAPTGNQPIYPMDFYRPQSDEISEVIWVTEDTLNDLVWGRSGCNPGMGDFIMWKRIRTFLQRTLKPKEKFYQCLRNHALRFFVSPNRGNISS